MSVLVWFSLTLCLVLMARGHDIAAGILLLVTILALRKTR